MNLPLTLYTKINSKWISDLNVKLETIKLEENTGEKRQTSNFTMILNITPKVWVTKEKR